ncbi:MAG: DUF5011 domain-containing protein [Flavobacterium nitrogenifigens]|uniref:Pesticidal crystal protein Cry22Aa Ig-like domain-containing protein n=1 Tax=Flavobacterium nitrogenifigens TaxID=1617283 RepID=A0A521EB45_9FLAO|nr:immunoglobulin-like domain-containing protein [Flavobacterium nitrogenifigens]KAF2325862.1 DUF5011 domain-containing protein [Flavobacterium nitrogenifigens]MDQ8012515.1 DUF5011 domain-containing protein [Flavobacterium nitrogenifigens]SMO81155.1 protein of unknown function [Flavobacterium nitrogenifigens]
MKKIFIQLMVFSSLLLTSCSADSDNVSKVTNYAVITIKGDNPFFLPLGQTYTDPGAVSTEGGAVIPTATALTGGKYRGGTTLDVNKIDEYTENYSAVNKDGYKATKARKIIVYKTGDLVNSIEGVYTSTVKRNGVLMSASQGSSVNMKYVYIWKNTDGTFGVSDAFGGWYDLGRSIGINSATLGGKIAGDIPTNTFTFPGNPLTNKQFGGSANITGLTVDPATKTLVLTTVWEADAETTYTFVSTLTQVQP